MFSLTKYNEATQLISMTFGGGLEHDTRKNPFNLEAGLTKRVDPEVFLHFNMVR